MNFGDEIIESYDLSKLDNIYEMIIEKLCGEIHYKPLEEEKDLLKSSMSKMEKEGLNYAQFSELLLLMNQDRINEAFFKFFFGQEPIKLEELKNGIIKFRCFAMLCFGNIRFAYQELIQNNNKKELEEQLRPFCISIDKVEDEYKKRPQKALRIKKIGKEHTWYNGYISKNKYDKETKLLNSLLEKKNGSTYKFSENKLLLLGDMYTNIGKKIEEVEKKALINTDIYLTWDYMDLYFATSMRHIWEFEETFDFIGKVMRNKSLKDLNLRYFDPTQSQCENRIDKGLIEGLMLKRAVCTIYMAQEIDTMGKDSELAATLSQGKPVIAYVPFIDSDSHAEKISDNPLDFFKTRFLVLQVERIFDDLKCSNEIRKFDPNFEKTYNDFIEEYEEYRCSQPFSLWKEEEDKFKSSSKYFTRVCKILSIAEHYSYERRARTLKEIHPLSIQVNLDTGVANGVLVVRNDKECADLLYRILTNSMKFTIKHIGEKNRGVTILEENISGSTFRTVTDNEKLTNSFWNFYLNF